jgi:hypothetical protein
VCSKETNEIEIGRSVGDEWTIYKIWGNSISVLADTRLVREKNQFFGMKWSANRFR